MKLLWAVQNCLQSVSKQMEREVGVTGPQLLAMRVMGRFPGVAPKAIAEILHVHPSTLTGILRRLELRKLVERKAHPSDGRQSQLSLTAQGRRLNRPQMRRVENAVRKTLQGLSEGDLATVRRVLTRLAEQLGC